MMNKQSKIEKLITELCPEEVEFKELGELTDIYTGSQLNKTAMFDTGKYPVMNGGINASGRYDKYNTEANTIAISQGGASAGFVNFICEQFWAGAHCFVVKSADKRISNKFIYYILKNGQNDLMNAKLGAGIPGLNRNELKTFKIPIPPMVVQEEIVKILDNFTALEAELEAELEARKKQCDYYRNRLVNYENKNTKTVKIAEVANILRGKRLTKDQLSNYNEYPVYHGGLEPLGNYSISNRKASTTMVINVGASAGTVGYSYVDFWSSDGCYCIEPSNQLISRYVYYALLCQENILRSKVRFAGIPTLDAKAVENLEIQVPSIEEQKRIVSILDKFDSLVNDISIGLPAELKARRQQYEYYRNKLLTFKEYAKQ